MPNPVVTLDATCSFIFPNETVEALGLHAGSKLGVLVKNGEIHLLPLLAGSLDELHGIFSSQTDLVEELQQERRQDKW